MPQRALSTDLDAYTNVESMRFSFDQEKNKFLSSNYNSQTASFPLPLPPITPLNPPLGLIPPLPTNLLPPTSRRLATISQRDRSRRPS